MIEENKFLFLLIEGIGATLLFILIITEGIILPYQTILILMVVIPICFILGVYETYRTIKKKRALRLTHLYDNVYSLKWSDK